MPSQQNVHPKCAMPTCVSPRRSLSDSRSSPAPFSVLRKLLSHSLSVCPLGSTGYCAMVSVTWPLLEKHLSCAPATSCCLPTWHFLSHLQADHRTFSSNCGSVRPAYPFRCLLHVFSALPSTCAHIAYNYGLLVFRSAFHHSHSLQGCTPTNPPGIAFSKVFVPCHASSYFAANSHRCKGRPRQCLQKSTCQCACISCCPNLALARSPRRLLGPRVPLQQVPPAAKLDNLRRH